MTPVSPVPLRRIVNRWLSPDHAVGQAFLAGRMRAQLLAWRPTSPDDRALHAIIATLAPEYTMVDLSRLRSLADHAKTIHHDRIPGAVVDCGTWRGGSLALVDWVLRRAGDPRPLWAFDSFSGLPPPGTRDPESARRSFFDGWCTATEEDVKRAIAAAGGQPDAVKLVRGWLADTVNTTDTGPIALLNLDVDWYDSVRTALRAFYDRVNPGGLISIDDYGRWRGCDQAVHEFMTEREISSSALCLTGRHGAWMRKPPS